VFSIVMVATIVWDCETALIWSSNEHEYAAAKSDAGGTRQGTRRIVPSDTLYAMSAVGQATVTQ
jgi:hypothetical protein